MEWAIPMENDYGTIQKAMHPLFELIKQRAEEGKFPLSLVVEMRVMGDSDVYLSPAIGGMWCGANNLKLKVAKLVWKKKNWTMTWMNHLAISNQTNLFNFLLTL